MLVTRVARGLGFGIACLALLAVVGCGGGGGGGGDGRPYAITFNTLPPDGTLVNAPFTVEISITSKKTGQPVSPTPSLDVTLVTGTGAGSLSGTLTQTVGTPTAAFTGISYDTPETVTIVAQSGRSPDSTSTPIAFEVGIEVSPTDLGAVYPGDPVPAAQFTLLDGQGAPFPVSGRSLEWSLIDAGGGGVVQSGLEPFSGMATASAAPAPIGVEGAYRLVGNLEGSVNQAAADLHVATLELTFNSLSPYPPLVNGPFDAVLSITDRKSGLPVSPNPPLDITMEKVTGAGTLSGTLTVTAATDTVSFNGLSYDTFDSPTFRVTSVRTDPVVTPPIPFEVNIQANPAILGLIYPGDPIPPVQYTLYDGLGAPFAISGKSLQWAIMNLDTLAVVQTGTEPFAGSDTATVNAAPIVTEGRYVIGANLEGSANAATATVTISSLALTFTVLPPAGTLVNAPFDVEITVTDAKSGAPVQPSPPLLVTLSTAGGSGTLSGSLSQSIGTFSAVFSGLSYDAVDSLTILALSQLTAPVSSPPIPFEVQIQASPTNLGGIAPGDPIPFVTFSLLDGLGAPYPVMGRNLDWTVTDLVTMGVVQSGSAPFGGGDAVIVSVAPIFVEAPYRLAGNLQGSVNQASADFDIVSFTLQNLPGPFVALKSARVGQSYLDDVSFAVPGAFEWGISSGTIPAGIALDPSTGVLGGTPTTPTNGQFVLYAKTSAIDATPIRCALAVFSAAESEWIAGQSFVAPGPYTTVTTSDVTTFVSSFDSNPYTTNLIIYHPVLTSITSPLPLYVHHRGRGFNYQDYDLVLGRIASYGFICVSVEDYQSFFSPGSPGPDPFYDSSRADAGMESASAFQEGALDHMLARSATVGDPFEGKIDETKVFVGGHSRGGGATHGSHVRGLDLKINGAVYFMAFDLRYFSTVAPCCLQSPAYVIPDVQPRLPSLMFMAENDGDLSYPYADQTHERASGQATSVTVYGAVHNYLGDTNPAEGFAYITRQEQQDIIVNRVVAFLKRWGEMDLSLEGFLYGNEHKGSTAVGVTSVRNMVEAVLVDDFQDVDLTRNSLGGTNTFTGGSRVETSIYPPIGSFFLLNLRTNILTFSQMTATYSTGIPAGTDLTGRKRLVFRCGQTGFGGYDWATIQVRLTDAAAQSATVTLFDRTAPSATYLPDFDLLDPQRVYDRYVEVQVPLGEFTLVNPLIDTSSLNSVEFLFDFATIPSPIEQIYFDDLRFE